MKIFVLYRLRDDVSLDDYRRWSVDDDQPTLRSFSQVSGFHVYEASAAGSTANYAIVETIDVESAAAWTEITEADAVKALQPAFDRYVDPDSLCILQTEEIAG
jgi:hypothetical protein